MASATRGLGCGHAYDNGNHFPRYKIAFNETTYNDRSTVPEETYKKPPPASKKESSHAT